MPSAILSSLPDLPPLVETASAINGKPIRVKPRVNLGEMYVLFSVFLLLYLTTVFPFLPFVPSSPY
jgi:hypothetical protein